MTVVVSVNALEVQCCLLDVQYLTHWTFSGLILLLLLCMCVGGCVCLLEMVFCDVGKCDVKLE